MLFGLLGNKAIIVPIMDINIGLTTSLKLERALIIELKEERICECPNTGCCSLFKRGF